MDYVFFKKKLVFKSGYVKKYLIQFFGIGLSEYILIMIAFLNSYQLYLLNIMNYYKMLFIINY